MSKDYIGRVIYNEDPTFSGRCKIRVFSVFDDLPDQNIPWFVPANFTVFSGNGGGNISIPKVGDIVRVRFTNDDDHYYSGEYSCIQNLDPNLIDYIKDDYADTHVLLYDFDKKLLIIYQPKSGLKIQLNESFIIIDANGTIQLNRKDKNVLEIKDNEINIASRKNDNINITTEGTVNIKGGNIIIESGNINLGEDGESFSAVKGEKLVTELQTLSNLITGKFPEGGVVKDFSNILSSQVKIH